MPMNTRNTVAAAALAAAMFSAAAGPTETVEAVASKASAVATKVEGAVKKGVKKAASAVEHGAKVTGQAVTKTAKKLGLPTQPASGASTPASQ
jgi:adenosine/AMP kinase